MRKGLILVKELNEQYEQYRVDAFHNRIFPQDALYAEFDRLIRHSAGLIHSQVVGESFEGRPVRLVTIGSGTTNILLWSQMHGDEPTATAAICDILNYLIHTQTEEPARTILSSLHLLFLPMLNPDGAERSQRRTAQMIDMNRDALVLQTPEARILKQLQHEHKPEFGFNLHDQELSTIGLSKELTALSLLAPAIDAEKSDNDVRVRSKHVAAALTAAVNALAPGKLAKYDDAFEPRAFGDSVQQWGTSTVLVESGHWLNDPNKDVIRKLNFVGILSSLHAIASDEYRTSNIALYENLPLNGKRAYDVIVRNIRIDHGNTQITEADLGISYQVDTHSELPPKLVDVGDLSTFVGLKEIDGMGISIPLRELQIGGKFEWEDFFPDR